MFLIIAFIVAIGINLLIFLPAYILRTDKLTDLTYSLTFIILATYGLAIHSLNIYSIILWLMIILWAVRLGSQLFIRIKTFGKDQRYEKIRIYFWKYFRFWLIQGITVWIVLLPSLLFFNNQTQTISFYSYFGIFMWFTGLLIETVADYQKFKFSQDPKNQNKWIEKGLWKYSRHPNYFGEILLWFGVYFYTLSSLSLTESLLGLLGPLYISFLLIFISGIPILEKYADQRWGKNLQYKEYKRRTSILIPLPPKTMKQQRR